MPSRHPKISSFTRLGNVSYTSCPFHTVDSVREMMLKWPFSKAYNGIQPGTSINDKKQKVYTRAKYLKPRMDDVNAKHHLKCWLDLKVELNDACKKVSGLIDYCFPIVLHNRTLSKRIYKRIIRILCIHLWNIESAMLRFYDFCRFSF